LVVFELRVYHLDVLIVLAQECLEVNESFLYALGQISDSL